MRSLPSLVTLLSLMVAVSFARANDPLAAGFVNPPDSARPHTWWHWMNGNVTKEGITADLEAMKRVGVGGAQIFVVDCDIPHGPVKIMSPEFLALVKHAASEADRLGLELCLHNCGGWSSSGGPWNTPEHAMQFVTTSELRVKGPTTFNDVLPTPPNKLNYYRDVEVLAFRTPASEMTIQTLHPAITTNANTTDNQKLADGDTSTIVSLPRPEREKPQYVQVEFAKPLSVRSVSITLGKGETECGGVIQASEDGQNFIPIRRFAIPRRQMQPFQLELLGVKPTSRFLRIQFERAGRNVNEIPIAEIELGDAPRIDNIQSKALFEYEPINTQSDDLSQSGAIRRDDMVDLTDKLSADGKLKWDVPEGNWTILRIGHTPTGVTNHPAPREVTGPEVDKFSREALDAHWNGYVQKILDEIGPLAGKSVNNSLIDSYEVGGQNWTPKMKEEFQKRRGYDMTRFLPVFGGRIVDSPEISERFLWDLRRTASDLFADNYYAYFAELCHKHNLLSSSEPYTGPFESLQVGASADIPMGEFWSGGSGDQSVKLAASVAHIYGKKIIGAESFTADQGIDGWRVHPYMVKALGDAMFCQGINRYIFHRYAQQPWLDRVPGMTMGPWGFHFDRTNTWFEKSTSWLKYVARCQYLLQQGLFVADAAYFVGEGSPVETKLSDPPLPKGYDCDAINADVLLNRAAVKDGRITLTNGMSYKVLVLPPKPELMTPAMMQKIRQLVNDGAIVVGPKPRRSPSLTDYPKCDEDVRMMADEVWGDCDGRGVTEHAFGKGKVVWGKPLADVFNSAKLKPDFDLTEDSRAKMVYIHRIAGDADIYFVSNQRDVYAQPKCIFRVAGKVPQLWHPDTGLMEPAPVYSEADGRTTIPIQFDPSGSVFVIFHKGESPATHLVDLVPIGPDKPASLPKIEVKAAVYEAIDGQGSMDVKGDVSAMIQAGIETIEVKNQTFGMDPAPNHVKELRIDYSIDGKSEQKTVRELDTLDIVAVRTGDKTTNYELVAGDDGKVDLLAWKSSQYEVKLADGSSRQIKAVRSIEPLAVEGAWEVHFPPKMEAPEQITLKKLISFTEYPDDGVKYFSGTATYLKEIDIPAEMLSSNRALYLDLGRVKNFAQVSMNGHELGILWKPPFRVNLAGVATAGKNTLEIKITNLWPNRLIGDEKIGEQDAEWKGKQLARWPQWLLDGKPSPSGRITFATWHHWTKDMQPLESGLLGPVTVNALDRMPLH